MSIMKQVLSRMTGGGGATTVSTLLTMTSILTNSTSSRLYHLSLRPPPHLINFTPHTHCISPPLPPPNLTPSLLFFLPCPCPKLAISACLLCFPSYALARLLHLLPPLSPTPSVARFPHVIRSSPPPPPHSFRLPSSLLSFLDFPLFQDLQMHIRMPVVVIIIVMVYMPSLLPLPLSPPPLLFPAFSRVALSIPPHPELGRGLDK